MAKKNDPVVEPIHETIVNNMAFNYINDPGKYDRNGNYNYECLPENYDPKSKPNYFKVLDIAYFHLIDKSREEQIKISKDVVTFINEEYSSFFFNTVVWAYIKNGPQFIKDIVKYVHPGNKKPLEDKAESLLTIILNSSPEAKADAAAKAKAKAKADAAAKAKADVAAKAKADVAAKAKADVAVKEPVTSQLMQSDNRPEPVEEVISAEINNIPIEPIAQVGVMPQVIETEVRIESENTSSINNNKEEDYIVLKKVADDAIDSVILLGVKGLGADKYSKYASELTTLRYAIQQKIDEDYKPSMDKEFSDYKEKIINISQDVAAKLAELNQTKVKWREQLVEEFPIPARERPLSFFEGVKLFFQNLMVKIKNFFGMKIHVHHKDIPETNLKQEGFSDKKQTDEGPKEFDLGPKKESMIHSPGPSVEPNDDKKPESTRTSNDSTLKPQ